MNEYLIINGRIIEEIALLPVVIQNQDDEVLNKRKLHCKSNNIQNQNEKPQVFIR